MARCRAASWPPVPQWQNASRAAGAIAVRKSRRNNYERNFRSIFDRRSALVGASCVVRRNGQPLSGAEVRFVPLPALQDVLPTGSGVSDSYGAAMITPPREELPAEAPNVPGLMPPGLYVVEITHPTMKIPDKYNRNTVLGKEISSETVYRGAPRCRPEALTNSTGQMTYR